MKQTLRKITDLIATVLFLAMAMLALAALTTGCSPKMNVQDPPHAYPGWDVNAPKTQDTVTWIPFQRFDGSIALVNLDSLINSKVVIDTVMIAGELVEIHDSVPCPPGLEADSIVYITLTKTLPARAVPVSVTVMDTLWLTKPCPECPALPALPTIGGGWGERVIWIGTVLALIAGFFRQWRKENS